MKSKKPGHEEEGILPPRANPNLIGQEAAETQLLEAWNSGRLPHAWLLTGPRGIGKATLAYRFARFLFAHGKGADGSARSLYVEPGAPAFRRVASGGHLDLLTVERSWDEKRERRRSEIRVEEARATAGFLHMTAAEGGWRIVVIDAAEEMNREAANAVLKIVEEPPAQSMLLLISHAPGRLLPTIRSRCRRLALTPLSETQVVGLLGEHRPGIAPQDAAFLARLSEGSVGRALDLAEAGGIALYRDLARLLLDLPRLDVDGLHTLGERLGRRGAEDAFRAAADLLLWWLARMIREGAAGGATTELVPGETEAMRRLLAGRSLDRWLELWEKTARLFARTESAYLDRKQVWIAAFLDIEGLARS